MYPNYLRQNKVMPISEPGLASRGSGPDHKILYQGNKHLCYLIQFSQHPFQWIHAHISLWNNEIGILVEYFLLYIYLIICNGSKRPFRSCFGLSCK